MKYLIIVSTISAQLKPGSMHSFMAVSGPILHTQADALPMIFLTGASSKLRTVVEVGICVQKTRNGLSGGGRRHEVNEHGRCIINAWEFSAAIEIETFKKMFCATWD